MNDLRTSSRCLLALLTLALPAAAQEPQAPAAPPSNALAPLRLSRQQAVDAALANNPALAAARAQVEEARAQVVIATAFPNPTFSVDAAGERHLLNPGSGNAKDQEVDLTVPFPGKRSLQRSVATADVRAAELNLTQLRQQVASQAVQAYDAILVALRHREDLEQNKALASDFVEKTQARFRAGTVPKVDVVKATVDQAQAENDLIANERDIATARASLNRTLGRMAGAPIETTDALDIPAPLPQVEALESRAQTSRPELQTLAAQIEGARSARQLANRYWEPDFTVSFARNAVDGSPSTYTTGIGVGVPIFFWQHRNGEVAQAQHREEELLSTVADLRAQVSLEVQTAFAGASTAIRQAIFIRDELLPEAREVYRVASVSYGLGGSSALDLLDAKRTLLDAESQYVEALGAANDAVANLELAVGASLSESNSGEHQK